MTHARELGDYFNFESVLPGYLREFVILLAAREWSQNYEWNVHYPRAIEQGFSPEMAQAVAEGRRSNTSRVPLPTRAAPALTPFPH